MEKHFFHHSVYRHDSSSNFASVFMPGGRTWLNLVCSRETGCCEDHHPAEGQACLRVPGDGSMLLPGYDRVVIC